MKKYIAPRVDIIELRAEERIATAQVCNGECTEIVEYDGVTYYPLIYS